jgi:hypothetical protein
LWALGSNFDTFSSFTTRYGFTVTKTVSGFTTTFFTTTYTSIIPGFLTNRSAYNLFVNLPGNTNYRTDLPQGATGILAMNLGGASLTYVMPDWPSILPA